VRRVCESLSSLDKKPGGMMSTEIREGGVRVGFMIEDIITHASGVLAHVRQNEGPQVGKYRVNLTDIQRIGAAAIRRAISEAKVIIVDEIGPMELNSMPFILAVEMALASPKHFLGTVHKRASHYLVEAIKSNPNYEFLEVTQVNREQIPNKILERLGAQE